MAQAFGYAGTSNCDFFDQNICKDPSLLIYNSFGHYGAMESIYKTIEKLKRDISEAKLEIDKLKLDNAEKSREIEILKSDGTKRSRGIDRLKLKLAQMQKAKRTDKLKRLNAKLDAKHNRRKGKAQAFASHVTFFEISVF